MRSGLREAKVGVLASFAFALSGCAGLLESAPGDRADDGGGARVDAAVEEPAPTEKPAPVVESGTGVDVYGAKYQGDAGACATVVCSGAQVCCVLPIPSDASTLHPNNRCDYDCVAVCMDSCPAVSADGVDAAPSLTEGMHGGGVRELPADGG
jgi:hypothetical protein